MRWLLSDANAEQFPSNGTCCSREVAVRCFSAEANVMSLGRGNRARYSIVVSKQWELVTSVKRRLKTLKNVFLTFLRGGPRKSVFCMLCVRCSEKTFFNVFQRV